MHDAWLLLLHTHQMHTGMYTPLYNVGGAHQRHVAPDPVLPSLLDK
jgi:hypothetical protein